MTNEELLKRYVKEHDSVLELYQHYDDNEERSLRSMDEYLLHEESFYKSLTAKAKKAFEETCNREKECTYYDAKNKLDRIQHLLETVTDSNTRYWLKTNKADGTLVIMPVVEETLNLEWGIEEMGNVNLKDAGRVTNVMSFLWGDERVYICEDGEVLYKTEKNSVVVRKERGNE